MTKININGTALGQALAAVSKIAVAADNNITFEGQGGKLVLHSFSDINRAAITVPCEISGKDFEFALPLDAIRDAIKGREELDMGWDGSKLLVKAKGGYTAELITLDPLTRDTMEKVDSQEWRLSPEQGVWLKTAVAEVALRPTTLVSSFIPVSVKLSSKGAFVACYDNQHMAFLRSDEVQGELELTVPLDSLSLILDVLANQAFKIRVSKARVELRSKSTLAVLGVPDMDDGVSIADVQTKAKEVVSAKGIQVQAAKSDVLAFLDNARAVIGKERAELEIVTKENKVKLTVKTVRGTSSAIVKADVGKEFSIKVDYEYFDELLRKVKGEALNMAVVGQAFMSFKDDVKHQLVALNQ